MADGFRGALSRGGVIPGDGAMGSELMKRGLQPGEAPETWNTAFPGRVKDVHAAYIEAGSRFLLTNTFGGNELKLAKSGLADRMREINEAAVTLLRDAAGGTDVFLAGDIGPTGEFMEPLGTCGFDDFRRVFREQAAVLAGAGVDCIMLETMADIGEAKAAVTGVREACDLPLVVSMTFERDAAGDGYHTMMGTDIGTFVAMCEEMDVEVVGTNCGKGAQETVGVAARIRELTKRPVLAFPNAGVPRVENGVTVYDQDPMYMKPYFEKLVEMGVTLVGGCCGTTPAHIAVIADIASRSR